MKKCKPTNTLFSISRVVGFGLGLVIAAEARSAIWFVDAGVAQSGDGTTWATAFRTLQEGLDAADQSPETDQIWAAQGTYFPSVPFCSYCDPGDTNERHMTFRLLNGVGVYGGFLGNTHPQGGETALSQRDAESNITILSGNIDPTGGPDDAFHVVTAVGIDNSAILNGFTITDGKGDGVVGTLDRAGGGMLIFDASPTVARCAFVNNVAQVGGGVFLDAPLPNGVPRFVNCSFVGNMALDSGAMRIQGGSSETSLVNCVFSGNTATLNGGALLVGGGTSTKVHITNCAFSRNDAVLALGGAILITGAPPMVTVVNSILWGNTADGVFNQIFETVPGSASVTFSDVMFGWPGEGNIGEDLVLHDPKFCDDLVDNLRLLDGSPCIDTGNDADVPPDNADVDDDGNTAETLPWDRDNESPQTQHGRFFDVINGPGSNTKVDMGAYENQHICGCPWDIASAGGGRPPDGNVGITDYLKLLADWGNCPGCGADFNCDLVVDGTDQSELLGHWGPCLNFCLSGPSGGGSSGSHHEVLEEALELMDFDDVEEYQEWLLQATDAEAFALGQLLAVLLLLLE